MNSENIEQILKKLGNDPTPPDVNKIAENLSDDFTNSLKPTRHILWRNVMRIILPLILMSFLMAGCSDESDEPAKYQFSAMDEYLRYHLPSR